MGNSREKVVKGELERAVLLAVLHLGEEAYGVAIRDQLTTTLGRELSLGAVYTTLSRLVAKGLLSTRTGEPSAARGGRAKRYFRLEAAAHRALEQARRDSAAMWALASSEGVS